MNIQTTSGHIVSLDTLLTVKDNNIRVEGLVEIPSITDNQTMWVVCNTYTHNKRAKIDGMGGIVVVDHIRKPRIGFPDDTYIDFGHDRAKEIYSDIFECDIKNVVCVGKIIQVDDGYRLQLTDVCIEGLRRKPKFNTLKLSVNPMDYAHTILTQSDGDIIRKNFIEIPEIKDDEKIYLFGLSVGGLMEDPELRIEGPYAIVIAGNVKDAEAIYNKAYNCSYFYGICIGELTDYSEEEI